MTKEPFAPDWTSPPGDTILDLLEEKNLSIKEFSAITDIPTETIKDLIKGYTHIGPDYASLLSKHLGGTKQFWITRQFKYDLSHT